MNSDLATLIPTTAKVIIRNQTGQEEFEITPFKWGQFCDVIKHIDEIRRGIIGTLNVSAEGSLDNFSLLSIVATHGDAVGEVIALALGKDVDFVSKLAVDDVVRIAAAVFEVNKDFFSQSLLPAMQDAMKRLTKKKPQTDGQM